MAHNMLSNGQRRNMHARILANTLLFLFVLCLYSQMALAEDHDEILEVLGKTTTESTSGRFPRLLSRTPENVTVINVADIEAINAHTLTDILATIPGVQIENLRGPASGVYTHIQGCDFNQVSVLLDGVPFNNLGDNFADVGQIPAQIIERVEIIKGAASSYWGQALGGVINVVTKTPDQNRKIGGKVSISHGERGSDDVGGEAYGTFDRFGYYLAAGYLGSGGFQPNTQFYSNNVHAKLTYDLPGQGQATFSFTSLRNNRGDFAYPPYNAKSNDDAKRQIVSFNLHQPISDHWELQLAARDSVNHIGVNTALLSTGDTIRSIRDNESVSGGSSKIIWQLPNNLMVAGMDYDHARMRSNNSLVMVDLLNRSADRWGFYLNDTLSIGSISLSPGLRYDLTGTSGDQFSPTFGATWQIGENTTLRGYTAKGFSLPSFTLDSASEKVWTSQVGVETASVPYVWLKGTLFRNDVWNITAFDQQTRTNILERQIKQGFEIEARSARIYHTALTAGYTYVDARRPSDNSVVMEVAPHTVQLGLNYDDTRWLRGSITGSHIWWNALPSDNGKYYGILWDMHLTANPFGRGQYAPELFFSLHNAFNGSQYLYDIYKNNGRWLEGGVRFRF